MRALPENLAEFWRDTTSEAKAEPLDYRRQPVPEQSTPEHQVDRITFRGFGGTTRQGWVAVPPGARRERTFLWLPPYGRESKLPDRYGTRPGMVSLSLNYFGEDAFHQEAYTPARGYFAEGVGDAEGWIFRRMYQDGVILSRIAQSLAEVDESRIGAAGMSQGGGMAIWQGAWNSIVRSVAADMPFLSDIAASLSSRVYRYPLKELHDAMEEMPMGRERVLFTVDYYDTSHQARFCHVPTRVTLGRRDPACRPETVRQVYEALPGPKELQEWEWGHDWHPEMVEGTARWLRETMP